MRKGAKLQCLVLNFGETQGCDISTGLWSIEKYVNLLHLNLGFLRMQVCDISALQRIEK
jgi:hypothetical protein